MAFAAVNAKAVPVPITGVVADARNGFRLASMVVRAYEVPAGVVAAEGTTGPNGAYVLAVEAAGQYRVLAFDPDGNYATQFDGNADSFETTPIRTVTSALTVNFALVTAGRLAGFVSSTAGSVAGVTVAAYNLSGTRRAFTTVAATGEFSIVVPPGDYKLVAYDEQRVLATAFYPGARSFAAATPVHVNASSVVPDLSLILTRAASLIGTARDMTTGLPLAGITLAAFTPEGDRVTDAKSDANGTFTLSVPAGGYRLVASDEAGVYAPAFYERSSSFETSTIITVSAGGQRRDLALALPRGGTLSGHVSAGPDITVSAYNADGTLHTSVTTDASGDYRLVVAPGDYKVAASDPSGIFATQFYAGSADFASARTVAASAGATLPAVDFTLVRAGRLSGLVTTEPGALPAASITVAVYSDATAEVVARTTTGGDGRFALSLPPGRYRVIAYDEQLRYATAFAGAAASFDAIEPLDLAADATASLDFSLRRGVKVSGTIVDTHAIPISGVDIFAIAPDGQRVASGRSVDGAFSLVVVPGPYRFAATDTRGRYSENYFPGVASIEDAVALSIFDGQSPRLTFTLTGPSRRRAVRH